MFLSGFEKIAYDANEHVRDLEATDLKHMAKRNPYTWGAGLIGAGAATGAALNRWSHMADAKSLLSSAKRIKAPKKDIKKLVQYLKNNPEEFMSSMKARGLKRGAVAGGALGALAAVLHAKRVNQGRKLESMPPEYRDVYLSGALGH